MKTKNLILILILQASLYVNCGVHKLSNVKNKKFSLILKFLKNRVYFKSSYKWFDSHEINFARYLKPINDPYLFHKPNFSRKNSQLIFQKLYNGNRHQYNNYNIIYPFLLSTSIISICFDDEKGKNKQILEINEDSGIDIIRKSLENISNKQLKYDTGIKNLYYKILEENNKNNRYKIIKPIDDKTDWIEFYDEMAKKNDTEKNYIKEHLHLFLLHCAYRGKLNYLKILLQNNKESLNKISEYNKKDILRHSILSLRYGYDTQCYIELKKYFSENIDKSTLDYFRYVIEFAFRSFRNKRVFSLLEQDILEDSDLKNNQNDYVAYIKSFIKIIESKKSSFTNEDKENSNLLEEAKYILQIFEFINQETEEISKNIKSKDIL